MLENFEFSFSQEVYCFFGIYVFTSSQDSSEYTRYYRYNDGLTNTLWPGSAVTQLSLCGMNYGKWFRFAWKAYAALLAAAFALTVIADKISYGPF